MALETTTIIIIVVLCGFFVLLGVLALVVFFFSSPSTKGTPYTDASSGALSSSTHTETVFYSTLHEPTKVLTLDVKAVRQQQQQEHPHVKAQGIIPYVAQGLTMELLSRHGPDSILAFYDSVAKVFVEVDLPLLISDPSRMEITAAVPLCVVHGDDAVGMNSEFFSPTSGSLHTGASAVIPVPREATAAPPTTHKAHGSELLDPRSQRLPLVTPRIYPVRETLITTSRVLQVVANRYVDVATKQLATLDVDVVIAIDELLLTIKGKKRAAAESRKLITLAKATVRLLGDDVNVEGLPVGHGLTTLEVSHVGQTASKPVIIAVVPGRVRVCWTTDAVWDEFEPFTLPAGRWCVRAESVSIIWNPSHHPVCTASSTIEDRC
jgi:hypothetical protein